MATLAELIKQGHKDFLIREGSITYYYRLCDEKIMHVGENIYGEEVLTPVESTINTIIQDTWEPCQVSRGMWDALKKFRATRRQAWSSWPRAYISPGPRGCIVDLRGIGLAQEDVEATDWVDASCLISK